MFRHDIHNSIPLTLPSSSTHICNDFDQGISEESAQLIRVAQKEN